MPDPAPEQPDRLTPGGSRRGLAQPQATGSTPGPGGARPGDSTHDPSDATDSAAQAGVDVRRRGWFWHWNTVVTQYAPLLGLKGVGLLNSYTVWTDRREESPHRGYAFPSQQAEADFYGEDRAELITINKILVALDLIEIRKEMILRVDDRGRRWRVPHNLYRVKDREQGVSLRAHDVLAVAKLAERDAAVYRYVRRIFSARFAPIDRDNVWHAILEEIADDPTWRALCERTRQIEERASARTRAGHRQRARAAATATTAGAVLTDGQLMPCAFSEDEQSAAGREATPSSVAPANEGSPVLDEADVASINSGSGSHVGPANDGSHQSNGGIAARFSNGSPTAVAPANTTYDQDQITTTTTTTTRRASARDGARPVPDGSHAPNGAEVRAARKPAHSSAPAGNGISGSAGLASVAEEETTDETADAAIVGSARVADLVGGGAARASGGRPGGGGPAGEHAAERGLAHAGDGPAGGPVVDPSPLVVSIFEAANDRRATPLERILLGELERDAEAPARAAGSTGADWLVAALREAVASGSTFVAPKRVREIVQRWAADSDGPRGASGAGTPQLADAQVVSAVSSGNAPASADVRLPGGARGARVWQSVLDDLAGVLAAETFDLLLAGSVIRRYWRGTVEVEVRSRLAADKLSTEYRALVERQLNARLSKPVAVTFHVAEPVVATVAAPAGDADTAPASALVVSRADLDLGWQVWHAVLADLAASLAPGDDDRLSGVVPLGQDAAGMMLLASPSPVTRRLLDERYRRDVERSLSTLLGHDVRIRLVGRDEWTIAADGSTTPE